MKNYIKDQIKKSYETKQVIYQDEILLNKIVEVAQKCVELYRGKNKTILAGNGGSAADAQHIAAELVGRYGFDRPSIPSLALTTDTSNLTAIGNDFGFGKPHIKRSPGIPLLLRLFPKNLQQYQLADIKIHIDRCNFNHRRKQRLF